MNDEQYQQLTDQLYRLLAVLCKHMGEQGIIPSYSEMDTIVSTALTNMNFDPDEIKQQNSVVWRGFMHQGGHVWDQMYSPKLSEMLVYNEEELDNYA